MMMTVPNQNRKRINRRRCPTQRTRPPKSGGQLTPHYFSQSSNIATFPNNKQLNKGINKQLNKDLNKQLNKGINKQLNKDLNKQLNKGTNKHLNKGLTNSKQLNKGLTNSKQLNKGLTNSKQLNKGLTNSNFLSKYLKLLKPKAEDINPTTAKLIPNTDTTKFSSQRIKTTTSPSYFHRYNKFIHNIPILLLLLLSTLPCGLLATGGSPPSYSRDKMPNTSFTCDDKTSGGYYADYEARCQMFHVCVRVSEKEINDHKFLCPNNTIFDQQNFICASWWETECKLPVTTLFKVDDPWSTSPPSTTTSTTTPASTTIDDLALNDADAYLYYEYLNDYGHLQDPSLLEEYEYPIYESGRTGRSKKEDRNPLLARSVVQPSTNSGNSLSKTFKTKELTSKSKEIRLPVTARKVTTSTTTQRPSTLPTILTTSNGFQLPFEASFAVGKPVVSISSTSSRFEVSSPRYEASTPKYGYFSVQYPSTTPKYEKSTVRRSTPRSLAYPLPPTEDPTTKRPNSFIFTPTTTKEIKQIYREVKEFKESDLALVPDSEDPFADIDWKKDFSGVTATTKTRYETSFGSSVVNKRNPSSEVRAIGRRRKVIPQPVIVDHPAKSTSVTSSVSSTARVTATRVLPSTRNKLLKDGSIGGRRRSKQRIQSHQEGSEDINFRPRRIFTGPSRQDFSNFRYFKTAFGSRTESPDNDSARPNRSRQSGGNKSSDTLFSKRILYNSRRQASVRPQRTASRNTRYSIYA